jgi:ABC-2 type transport system ATP-binding protein
MSIEVNNLSKWYGTQKAVDNISFSIPSGAVVGFLGPNGAGKSTTLKIITGYLQATSGVALVGGVDVRKEPQMTKRRMGYLPEANPLYTDMYVREYLQFIAALHNISHARQKTEEAIVTVGLTPESKKKIHQLSKGYKQRVGLAAALLHNPEVLILDEPTSGLDPNQIIEIREVIKKLGQQKTILFSSHILQEVEALCDSVIIIHKGVIVANDHLQVLKNKPARTTGVSLQVKNKLDYHIFSSSPFHQVVTTKDDCHFQFETQQPDELKKWLLTLSLEKNIDIVSLQTENKSLEEIFRQLTQTTTA